jgi:hypothetical protein
MFRNTVRPIEAKNCLRPKCLDILFQNFSQRITPSGKLSKPKKGKTGHILSKRTIF